ncbi:membrane protein YczE [Streptomyces jumonjinensis]|uniref:membrane protein YczE n=1 Tax=Streptomyces jumonjinensis TaxID=1945 RepID=UPI00378D8138
MSNSSSHGSTHLSRRLFQLYLGLALYGASSALLVRGALGLEPWNVLHQGLAERTGLTIGVMSIIVGAVVLLLWIPLRQRPGLGTVSNVFVIGLAMDGTLALVPEVHGPAAQIAMTAAGIVINGAATGLYIAARFGPGPRDGLMTGLHRVTGRSIRVVRTGIELTVVATGFLLGGSVGIGTVAYALAIGPLAQLFLRVFAVSGASGTAAAGGGTASGSTDGTANGTADSTTSGTASGTADSTTDGDGEADGTAGRRTAMEQPTP